MSRHFYRCKFCLLVAAVEDNIPQGSQCGICQKSMFECMGRVHDSRLVEDGTRPACDARCTNAAGPDCNCQCGSANHGSGMVVNILLDKGAVPVLMPAEKQIEKHTIIALEYKIAIEKARQASKDLLNSGWISDKKLWILAQHGLGRALSEASGAKTQKKRLDVLNKYVQKLTGVLA